MLFFLLDYELLHIHLVFGGPGQENEQFIGVSGQIACSGNIELRLLSTTELSSVLALLMKPFFIFLVYSVVRLSKSLWLEKEKKIVNCLPKLGLLNKSRQIKGQMTQSHTTGSDSDASS